MNKLNLGCGDKILPGYLNVDLNPREGITVMDITKVPWKIDKFDEILASQIFEHIEDVDSIVQECYNHLNENGKLIIEVPYYLSHHAWKHPQHKKAFSLYTFDFYVQNNLRRDYPFVFKSIKRKLVFPKGFRVWNCILEPIFNKIQYLYETSVLRFIFTAMGIKVELTK